jgi:quinolinate synthase
MDVDSKEEVRELQAEILGLKRERDALLLVHNYQRPEIQDIADIMGDSLGLSIKASQTESSVIVFCGVDFMAQSAKILSPQKTVLHPNQDAKCPMAAMIDVESLRELKAEHPDAVVVSYVNTTADVKAETDICCTSANAIKVVKSVPEEKVIFTPDENLGLYVKRFVKDKEFVLWPGYCYTHSKIYPEEIKRLRDLHPAAVVMVHPECPPETIDASDHVLSTEGMVNLAQKSDAKEFIVGTEKELCYRLKKENPGKEFYPPRGAVCPHMKYIRLIDVLSALKAMNPEIELPDDVIEKARKPLERMVEIGRGD